ncbi:MAG: hypothetical protein MZV64_49590 [Ignavibacteriales bacterium]|nr:hypothetical protein [Ignavibacteriales bacterium]
MARRLSSVVLFKGRPEETLAVPLQAHDGPARGALQPRRINVAAVRRIRDAFPPETREWLSSGAFCPVWASDP